LKSKKIKYYFLIAAFCLGADALWISWQPMPGCKLLGFFLMVIAITYGMMVGRDFNFSWKGVNELKDNTVIYTDEVGVRHEALVTIRHSDTCVNLVYVSGDQAKQDVYGTQIERASSVGRKGHGTAPGGRFFEDAEVKPLT
jgi:hypothetical protein